MTQLWLKYRPDSLAQMVGLDGLKEDASGWIVYEQNEHRLRCGGVIFTGGPGTGKTSAARARSVAECAGVCTAYAISYHPSSKRGSFIRCAVEMNMRLLLQLHNNHVRNAAMQQVHGIS